VTGFTKSRCDPLPSAVVRGSLEHGLLVCLALLDHDRACFEPAAVAWLQGLAAVLDHWIEGQSQPVAA
jgi:hypothetical protein